MVVTAGSGYVKMTGFKQGLDSLLHFKDILNTSFEGSPSEETWGGTFTRDDMVIVEKDPDKDFVILNLTDMHFGDYDMRRLFALGVCARARMIVNKVKPDLITVTGDIVCTDSTYYSAMKFTDLMESFGVPWAPVFGNHDDEGNCDLNYLAETFLKSPHCLMRKGPASLGVGNYVVGIEEEKNGQKELKEALIMMDSHHSACNPEQVRWFRWAAQGVNTLSQSKAEKVLMMHIPIAQYQYACDEFFSLGKLGWTDENAVGTYGEKVCCQRDENGDPIDNGMFAEIKGTGCKYVFCGHEHLNDFSVVYDGVSLKYNMKIGMGSGYNPLLNGGTKIVIGSKGIASFTDLSPFRNVLSVDTGTLKFDKSGEITDEQQ